MPLSEMIIVWTIACGDRSVDVAEDGRVMTDDAELRERIQSLLTTPVDVTRSGSGGVPMVLQPHDRRYVVARVRKMVQEEDDLQIVDLYFTGEPGAESTDPS